MASLYADEQFPLPVVELLRNLGHNVLNKIVAISSDCTANKLTTLALLSFQAEVHG